MVTKAEALAELARRGITPPVSAKSLATREQMQLDEARNAARQADEAARTAEQFVELNTKQPSGQIWAAPGLAALAGTWNSDVAQMNALTARMAPQQRVPGSGTTSDRDLSLYLQAVPGMSRPGPANQAIAQQARKDAQRRLEYANFLDQWAAQHGTLIGAEQAWATSQRRKSSPAQRKPQAQGGYKILSVD